MLKIDFGSGYNPYKGYKTCDITYSPFLDYVYDKNLNIILGLEENSVDIFRLKNVLHHCDINNVVLCFKKYLKNDGLIEIIEPTKENYESNRCLDIFWYRYIYPRYEISIPPIKRIDYTTIFLKHNFTIYSYKQQNIYDITIFKNNF